MNRAYQINNADIYDLIRFKYMEVYDRALRANLSTDNIQIHLRADLKEALEMGDTLLIGYGEFERNIPVIIDDVIKEQTTPDGSKVKSNIFIYDPEWPEWVIPND